MIPGSRNTPRMANLKRNTRARDTTKAAILSNNPFSVARGTFTAQIPWHHWKPAEGRFRGAHTWQGVKRLSEAPRGLSAAISIPDQSAAIDSEFSLFLAAILSLVSVINSLSSLCHPRRVLARLVDTFRRCGLVHLSAARFERISTTTVYITQGRHSLHHSARLRFGSLNLPQFASPRAVTVCIT